jgi:DNA-3-methyladenine glycosylase II
MRPAPVLLDSPSWARRDQLTAERILADGAKVRAGYDFEVGHWRLQSEVANAPPVSFFAAELPETVPMIVRRKLARLDGLQRFAAGCYWEALGTAVIRQVIRAGQARRLWHRLAGAMGDAGRFPSAERFLTVGDGELTDAGLGFKIRTLRTVAEACLAERRNWDRLGPVQLHDAWLTLPGIGPWSAGAAIADLRNAWQLYPHDDLAVRTWAFRAFPESAIPTNPRSFLRCWTDWGGETVGTLTVLTLGWSATVQGTS